MYSFLCFSSYLLYVHKLYILTTHKVKSYALFGVGWNLNVPLPFPIWVIYHSSKYRQIFGVTRRAHISRASLCYRYKQIFFPSGQKEDIFNQLAKMSVHDSFLLGSFNLRTRIIPCDNKGTISRRRGWRAIPLISLMFIVSFVTSLDPMSERGARNKKVMCDSELVRGENKKRSNECKRKTR